MFRAPRFSCVAIVIATLLATPFTPLQAACPDFAAPSVVNSGTGPAAIAVGDFNRDGLRDLAIANSVANTVSILLANTSGGFDVESPVTTGSAPVALLAADFTRDGRLDLAIVNSGEASLTVVTGNGFGGFGSPTTRAVGSGARAIVAADFNLDGAIDLAVVNATANSVSVLTGNSFGTFSTSATLVTGTNPRGLAAGDFDGDGDPDLVVANRDSNSVTMHRGNGDGTFAAASSFAIPPKPPAVNAGPSSIATGDFDRDGTLDLAVTAELSNSVAILPGNGAGSFGTATSIGVGTNPQSVSTADVNGDGADDVVVANRTDDTVSVLAGDGVGGFAAAIAYPSGDEPVSLSVADIDGDAKPDILAANIVANQVSILLSTGSCFANCGTFAAAESYGTSTTGSSVTTGDFDTDGDLDFAIANENADTVAVSFGNGAGGFGSTTSFSTGSAPTGVVAADVDRDGDSDLVVANHDSDTVAVLRANGSGSFALTASVSLDSGTGARAIAAGDFNGDGAVDFAVTGDTAKTLVILLNSTAPGGFPSLTASTISSVGTGEGPRGVASGDFNGDGKLDLVVADFADGLASGSVLLFQGNGSGSFSSAGSFSTSTGTEAVALSDFDHDGDLDLAAANRNGGNVTIGLGNGSGSFSPGGNPTVGSSPTAIAVLDVDLDGHDDLAVTNSGSGSVSILLGDGNGAFTSASPATQTVGSVPAAIAAADFNRDGKADLVAATSNSAGNASILLNACPPPDLAIAKSHGVAFAQGGTGTYSIDVTNLAAVSSAGSVLVTDTLPAGLTATDIGGSGWTCTLSPLRCSRSDSLSGGNSWPSIAITVNIANNAPPSVTNIATLQGGADTNAANNSASDPTTILQRPDLTIAKSHAGNFSQGQNGATYTITVTNAGGAASGGSVSVVDALPAGLTATAMSGSGWTCTLGTLSCVRSDALAGGASYPAITLTVDVASQAATPRTNVVTVSGGGESVTSNNTASDPTVITPRPDLTIVKTHSGSFSQGQNGAIYSIVVANIGGAATTGTVTVADSLPAGLTASAMSGTGWSCTVGTATCTRSDALASGASHPAITLTVNVAANASSPLVNSVTVSGGGEVGTLNSSDTDSTVVKRIVPSCGRFVDQTTIPTTGSGNPLDVTMDDFNGDGDLDIAYINGGVDILAVMLGHGDGTFGTPATFATGVSPNALTSGDFDTDGSVDIALVNGGAGTTSVYLGNGDGTFATAVNYAVGNVPYTVATGYFNADAHLDLVVANNNSNNVSVLLGSSTGNFGTAVSYATAGFPTVVRVGDFDGDGKADLAVATQFAAVSVLRGVGDGTFGAATHFPIGNDPRGMVVGDFNLDGKQDLAIAMFGDEVVSVLIGNGDGTFAAKTDYPTGGGTFHIESDDFDGDSDADLAVAYTGGVGVLFGSGTGTFAAEVTEPAGTNPVSVAVGDINSDSRPDIIAANASSKTLSVILSGCIDLRVAKSHSGNFTQGQTGRTYSIVVRNADLIASSGAVTVTDTLPTGLVATSIAGSGWSCNLSTLSCTRSDVLAPGASHPAITLTVSVNSDAAATITNTATVAGGGDDLPSNNSASDLTSVTPASMIAATRLVATAVSTTQINVTWDGVTDATSYQIFRRSQGGGFAQVATSGTTNFADTGRTPGVTYVYNVKAVSAAAAVGPATANDLATTIFFTDDPLSPVIKAMHFTQLRTAIDAVRAAAGLGAATYTNVVAPGSIIRASDLSEMRTALNSARTALAVPALAYSDPSITAGTPIRGAQIQELRTGTK